MPYLFGASGPVTTQTTPSSASALDVSIFLMRAWGYGECRILPVSIPGSDRSSAYLPWPVVLPAESTKATRFPMMEKSLIALSNQQSALNRSETAILSGWNSKTSVFLCGSFLLLCFLCVLCALCGELSVLLLRRNRRLDRLVHLRVTGAAAQVPAEGVTNFFLARIRIAVQQRLHRNHEPGRAVAALRPAPVAISFLDRRQRAVLRDALHRGNLRRRLLICSKAHGQRRAAERRNAIDQHRARAA